MAHFAKLEENNVVTEVVVIDNINNMTPQGIETESVGVAYLQKLFGENTRWIQTSYNATFRRKFAGVGDTYDEENDRFVWVKPYPSWSFDEEAYMWRPPVRFPQDGKDYLWNENLLQWIEYERL
jgi:hypothetical protein